MTKIEFIQPKPHIEDWRVRCREFTLGSVLRAGEGRYIANCSHAETALAANPNTRKTGIYQTKSGCN